MRLRTAIILIVLLSTISYINTFKNEFVFDDVKLIVENYEIRNLSNIFHFSLMKQPVREVTFAIDYRIWKLNPAGYHLTNLILHLLCSVLVYFFVSIICSATLSGLPQARPKPRTTKERGAKLPITLPCQQTGNYQSCLSADRLPLIVALLFALHPIHTEAVAGIANRKELLTMLFLMLSFILYIKAQSERHKIITRLRGSVSSLPAVCVAGVVYIGSITCFLLALFSKFVAVSLPFLLLIYEIYFQRKKTDSTPNRTCLSTDKKRFWYLIPYFLILLTGVIYGIRHFKEIFWTAETFMVMAPAKYGALMLTMLKAFGTYVRLLILPYNLCAEYVVPLSQSVFEPKVIFSFLLLLILLFITIKAYKRWKFLSFGLAWFFITLLPVSNLIPANYIVAERYMYIPSLGFCVILGWLLCKCREKARFFILLSILIIYLILSINRNSDWRDDYSLWSKTVAQSPNSYIAHNNLGTAYDARSNSEHAILEYKKAIEINPSYKQALYNLMASYAARKEYEEGYIWYERLITIDPSCARAYIKAAEIDIELKYYDEAILNYQKAEDIESRNPHIKIGLGYVYEQIGEYEEAEEYYKKAIEIEPQNPTPYFNLGNVYGKTSNFKNAVSAFKTATQFRPSYAEAWHDLGEIYEYLKDYKNAIFAYQQFLKYWEGNPNYIETVKKRIEKLSQ